MEQYNAFLSYSHDDLDFAERISKRLRRYKAPRSTGLHNKRLKIFRDVERLTANPDLSDALTERLNASEKLVLLCSPSAAKSEYVDEEVATFLNLKSSDDLLFVVCRGTFEEGIPPVLQNGDEPLFIDLSNAKRKQFLDESLRLIAALYDVDYAKLFREDEKLRRRKRNAISMTIVTLLLLVFSGFLIMSTQPETWERVSQPALEQDLMPVHEFAVNKKDPSILLYEGQDARWGMNPRPEGYSLHPTSSFSEDGPDFNKNLKEYNTDPLVRIRFKLTEREGEGEVDLYGIYNKTKNQTYFYRSLKFNGMTKDSISKQIQIPPNIESISEDPYNLSPWPLDILQKEGLYNEWDEIEGVLVNLITGEEVETSFYKENFDEGFDEFVEVWEPENRIFSNMDTESLIVLGDTLAYIENEYELWDSIVKSPEWSTYQKPRRLALGSVYENTQEAIFKIADSIPSIHNRDSLVDKLTTLSKRAEFTTFALLRSNNPTMEAMIIEATGVIDSPENIDGIPLQWLFKANATSAWHQINLPEADTGTSIIDMIQISATEVFIVTDSNGFFLTEDGGQQWREANFGETNLGNGQILITIATGVPSQVYCLVDRNTTFNEGENSLYKFMRRDWMQRWKAGLIRILQ